MSNFEELPDWLRTRVSAHRGYKYAPNSLAAIRAALEAGFIMVEFDVQIYDGKLILGHYNHEAGQHKETIAEALALFKGRSALPKIDIKLAEDRITPDNINFIVQEVTRAYDGMKLINLSRLGSRAELHTHFQLSSAAHAETLFYETCKKYEAVNIAMNVDVQRYQENETLDMNAVEKHIGSIKDLVYSLSPDLSRPNTVEATYEIAKRTGIHNIHFWLIGDAEPRTISQLKEANDEAVARGFHPLFDIDISKQLVMPVSSHSA